MRFLITSTFVLALVACNSPEEASVDDQYGSQLGEVNLTASCSDQANSSLERGLALLHHMTYEGSREAFLKAAELDPECALAYWGHAMTFIHPLWSDPPKKDDFDKGQALLAKARRLADNQKDIAYIHAAEAYYTEGWNKKETANLSGFSQAWEEVYQAYPEDVEAACLYALALMSTAEPTDKTFAKQRQAGEIVETVIRKHPEHPGAHHYIVHAYDVPPLAEKALAVARHYGSIATDIPHALHMPTHIFTRLGYWQESIDMNRRSASAALEHLVGGHLSLHYLHALDYLAYAHLQRAEDEQAKTVMQLIEQLEGPMQAHLASAYTLAAVPARVALERHQWAEAAAIKVNEPKNYPWNKFPAMEAITHFTIAIGAARSGQPELAYEELEKLAELHALTEKTSGYWAKQIEIQRLSARAWLSYEEGMADEALEAMMSAAELEASTEKHPVTPGEVLPARELLADMLFEMGHYSQAGTEYEVALERSPNRFNSLYGIGRSAELGGDTVSAARYYGKLIEISTQDSAERPELQQARLFLTNN